MNHLLNKAKLRYIDSSKYDAGWHSTLHSHAFTELFYVVRGEGRFHFSENVFVEVAQDDLVIINPNILHTEISDKDNPLEYIVLGIDGLEFFIQNANIGYSIHNYSEHKHEVLFYIKSILAEMMHNESFYETIIDNLVNLLIMNVLRRTILELRVYEGDKDSNKDCIFIENYINTHFKEPITLDLLADLTFMNKFYLAHEFKKYSGYSPIDFLLNKRLSEAKKLLSTTDLSISQIANIVGFGTASYFSQYFKKNEGASPSTYRATHKSTTG